MPDSDKTFVPLNVRIPKSQKEKMQLLHFNLSAFTRAALAKQLSNYKDNCGVGFSSSPIKES